MGTKQLIAILGVLAFLATVVALAATGGILIIVKVLGEERIRRWSGAASAWFFGGWGISRKIVFVAVILLMGYSVTLVGASTVSHQWELAPGQEKYFCEIDCHLAYSIAGVEKAGTLGAGSNQKSAAGVFYIVNVRTRFDEHTISAHRGDSPLTPSPRRLTLIDNQGRQYSISTEGQEALRSVPGSKWTPMTEPLRPGEMYSTRFVFDLPADAHNLNLLITSPTSPNWIGRLLIGDEGSILHKKVYLRVAS